MSSGRQFPAGRGASSASRPAIARAQYFSIHRHEVASKVCGGTRRARSVNAALQTRKLFNSSVEKLLENQGDTGVNASASSELVLFALSWCTVRPGKSSASGPQLAEHIEKLSSRTR